MGSKSRRPTLKVIEQRVKAGFGQGNGSKYKPFFFVRDVPSQGTSTMVKSNITGRTHHYLSRNEYKVHLLAEFDSSTLDIREQYALLPWEETWSTAKRLGIRYPTYPGTQTPVVLTTDLLISRMHPNGVELQAISVKQSKDLTPRNLEKLLIEKIYWSDRGVQWHLATEKNTPFIRASNLDFFSPSLSYLPEQHTQISPKLFSQTFENHHNIYLPYNEILKLSANELNINLSLAQALLGKSVWDGTSSIDIDTEIFTHRSRVRLR